MNRAWVSAFPMSYHLRCALENVDLANACYVMAIPIDPEFKVRIRVEVAWIHSELTLLSVLWRLPVLPTGGSFCRLPSLTSDQSAKAGQTQTHLSSCFRTGYGSQLDNYTYPGCLVQALFLALRNPAVAMKALLAQEVRREEDAGSVLSQA
jgi:hypothetical protein